MESSYNAEIAARLERIKVKRRKVNNREENLDKPNPNVQSIRSETPKSNPVSPPVSPKKINTSRKSKKRTLKKPKTKTIAIATKQLSSMVKTGLPIVEALSLVAETTDDKSIKIAFSEISLGIGKGNTIVAMMEMYPQIFDEMYLALADAGEQAGLLAEVLAREALLLESLAKLQGQIQAAMTYPIAISILVVIVVIIMLLVVIPVFVEMYQGSGVDLPFLTQLLVDSSNWLRNFQNVLLLLIGISTFVILFKRVSKTRVFIRFVDRLMLRLPGVNDLVTKSNLANFARTLSSLNSAGVPLLDSIIISKRTLGNSFFRDVVERMHESILTGDSISKSISMEPIIPKMFASMFRIGEETGELSNMVDKLADFYEDEVSTSVKSLTSILEPMMIVVVAVVVAVILVAMYLPGVQHDEYSSVVML